MRPRTLDEYAGQSHLLGPGKLLRRMLTADAITSIILHGPPGTGKTTLAELIAQHTKRHFVRENAAAVGVARIREIITEAEQRLTGKNQRTILFLDEIHRFTKAQQDVLLGDVERGLITLIGATTENPLFAVNSALTSRSTLFRLEPLTEDEVVAVLRRAIADPDRGFGTRQVHASDDALRLWAIKCDGDARRALTALEVAVLSQPAADPVVIDLAVAQDSIQSKAIVFGDDQHYDMASALIKSVRGGDPDAAVYWLARMLESGEDPRFIARRLVILASEDIGNADPHALPLATAGFDAVEKIGLPECRITLAQVTCYLALCPKSNASYVAIDEAVKDVQEGRTFPVPVYLRDGNSAPAGDGQRNGGYVYSQNQPGGIGTQDYLGVEKSYYRPTDRGIEAELAARLAKNKTLRTNEKPTGG
ncbi:MAG: replication-associated recombination protein A [Planctomycetes bacterium]|nr:replication-associated recombination protein A [Planctomycetota bacterium]